MEKFEDLICWQKGKELAITTYEYFRYNKDFGFKDQIQRAVVSVSNNIAEGFERKSNKEFKQFLYIAKGSCGETRSMFSIAFGLKYIDQKQFEDLYMKSNEICKIISGLIKKL